MKLSTGYSTAFVAVVFLLSVVSNAQSRVVDSMDSAWGGNPGSTQWQLASQVIVVTNDVTREVAESASQIVTATGMHILPGDSCLFCGTDVAGNGRVELWHFSSPGNLALQQSRVDVGRNFVGVAVAGGAIYLLDSAASTLLSGVWNGASALTGVGLSVVAQATTPNFPNGDDWTLTTLDDGSVAVAPLPLGSGIRVVPSVGGQASLVPLTSSGGHDAYAIPVLASEGDTTLTVIALTNTVFEIVRIGSGVIGAGVGAGVDTEVSVALSESLILGEQYVARAFGQATPTEYAFECVRRYGQSEVLSDGTEMQPFFYLAGAESGSAFDIQLALKAPLGTASTQYVGDLLIGFRLPNDPVLPLPDGRYLLSTSTIFPVSGWVVANTTQGGIETTVPIPGGLTDFVFLVQYVIYDGNEIRLSQIYGAEIK